MVKVVFHFTDWDQYPGTDNPQSIIYKWLHNSMSFGVDKIIMIDMSTYKIGQYYNHNRSDIEFERFSTLDEAMDKYSGDNWIFIEIHSKSTPINDFSHPENATYVVGPNHNSINASKKPHEWLEIPSNINYPLYDETAMMITLYDRQIKIK